MAEAIQLPHLPADLVLYVSLYQSVQNASFLREQLLAGNRNFEYAFIDASVIVSRTHLLASCFRALNDYLRGRMKSKNVHSEIVFCLSGNNNIGEAFSKFGIQPSTTTATQNLVIIKVPTASPPTTTPKSRTPTPTQAEITSHLTSTIHGSLLPLTDANLSHLCDWERVRKVYKIPAAVGSASHSADDKAGKGQEKEIGRRRVAMERAVLGAMALRGAT